MAEKHVYIFGEIGWENNVQSVSNQTKGATAEDKLIVHIHSPGGDVNEGFAIHDHLLSFGATVETRIEGLCASIATIIAMAGSKRTMTENSNFFVHNPWTITEGDANQLQETADQLKSVEEKIAAFYSKGTGKEKDLMLQLMNEAKDITPDRAIELGFVTEVVKPVMAMASYTKQVTHNSNIEQIMSTFIAKMEAKIKALLSPEAALPEVKNLAAVLEDGTAITIDTEGEVPVVGAAVTITESGEAAPDGTHILADGTTIVVTNGVIESIQEPMADATELAAENESLKAKVADLTNQISTIENKFDEFVKNLEQKQPIFNRSPRQPAPKKNEKPADRTGGKEAILAKLNSKKAK